MFTCSLTKILDFVSEYAIVKYPMFPLSIKKAAVGGREVNATSLVRYVTSLIFINT